MYVQESSKLKDIHLEREISPDIYCNFKLANLLSLGTNFARFTFLNLGNPLKKGSNCFEIS